MIWFTVLLLAVTIIQIRKIPLKKISYFLLPFDASLLRTWLSKIRRQDIPENYDSIRVSHIHFEEDSSYVVFYLPIKTLSSFALFHVSNVYKWVLKVITVCSEKIQGKFVSNRNQSNDLQGVLNVQAMFSSSQTHLLGR